jgi:hypothetical protein
MQVGPEGWNALKPVKGDAVSASGFFEEIPRQFTSESSGMEKLPGNFAIICMPASPLMMVRCN